jgi:hypothetical protein
MRGQDHAVVGSDAVIGIAAFFDEILSSMNKKADAGSFG